MHAVPPFLFEAFLCCGLHQRSCTGCSQPAQFALFRSSMHPSTANSAGSQSEKSWALKSKLPVHSRPSDQEYVWRVDA